MKKLLTLFLVLNLISLNGAWAQDEGEDDLVKSTQQDIMLVGAAGAAGAVLGLSTLSFVDKPSQHLSNVWTGAALGVIAGVIWVAYQGATKGQEELESSLDFRTSERVVWHQQNHQNLTSSLGQFGTEIWSSSF